MGRLLVLMGPLALLALAANSPAGQIPWEVPVASSTAYGFDPVNLVNGLGLQGDPPNLHDNVASHAWLAEASKIPVTVTFTFPFDGVYRVTEFRVWNYSANTAYGTKKLVVLTASGGDYQTLLTIEPLTQPHGAPDLTSADVFTVDAVARSVRFSLESNFTPSQTSYIGLSEVQFFGSPVPEPSTLVGLLGAGLAGVALAWRRMRRKAD